MSEIKFRKYPRAKWHKYDGGIYFITIVTHSRKHYFGYVKNGEMILSSEGKIAEQCLNEIPVHYPGVEIHNYVLMPNHAPEHPIDDCPFDERCHFNSRLSTIIGGFKSAVTKQIRKFDGDFRWQTLYHDHIVRNQRAYDNINQYITDNPIRWSQDCFNENK